MSTTIRIGKVLVANRGEIAVRIIRGCRDAGISTVAVYSEADRLALHTRLADQAVCIGPPPSKDSYLNQQTIIRAAKETGADGIHPGYGFLAENADFAGLVGDSGLIFIGPPAQAIRLMGDKTTARKQMIAAKVPIVPGSEETISDEIEAAEVCQDLGYPVLIKAAAGGGGRGMRIVPQAADLFAALGMAKAEAQSAFGDDRIYIEKYLESPRHIEFQILADQHGTVVHLGERECSIQRRHQKVIEETPSCALDETLRAKMAEAAVNAAVACSYHNAGTIEFMLDKHGSFYFLEMNTRLQVEHPVTEMVTGIDLVKEQIRIAEGQALGYSQKDIRFSGHAVECRIYAEDPANNFMPSTGRIEVMSSAGGPGMREDAGYDAGGHVSMYYDPLLSKVVAWGRDRPEAIARMKRALAEYKLYGVETSIPFCLMVMNHPDFIAGRLDTHFIDNLRLDALERTSDSGRSEIAAIAAALVDMEKRAKTTIPPGNARPEVSGWKLGHRVSDYKS